MNNEDLAVDDLANLKARADLLGITYHPSIKVEKLREKVNAALTSDEEPAPVSAKDQEAAERKRHLDEATKLIRIRVSCMNPAKKEWDGEIFTVGNSVVGTQKKYVPYNNEAGWHVPNIIYEHMAAAECQIFVTKTDAKGNKSRVGKLIKEFAIEVLPPLTAEELQELAQRQAVARSID